MAPAGQVKWQKTGEKARAGRIVEVWIGDAKLKRLVQEGVRDLQAELGIVPSFHVRHVGFYANVIQAPRLAKGDRLVGKRIRAREILDIVEPIVGINGQHGSGAEDVHIAGRKIETVNNLSLVLPNGLLVKLIWCLETVAREKQIQVKSVFGIGAIVDAIEDIAGRAAIVQH